MKTTIINKLVLLTILIFINSGLSASEEDKESLEESLLNSGIILNETISHIGNAFYQKFTKQWTEPKKLSYYTLLIKELPSARRGSLIWVEVNNKKIYQTTIPLRSIHQLDKYTNNATLSIKDKLTLTLKAYEANQFQEEIDWGWSEI